MTDSDKGLHILIVEDNPGDQYLLTELLRTSIIKVQLPETAGTLKEAIELLRSTTFDIILLDLLLPDSAGIDTLKGIKEFSGTTPVIILSGINYIKVVAEAIRHGAKDYHIKEALDIKLLTRTMLYCFEEMCNQEDPSKGSDPYVMMRRSELDLMHNSEITKEIMNGALDAIICIDFSGKIVAWNPQAEKMFGWSQQEILTKTLSDTIIPSQYRQAHEKGMEHFKATGKGPILSRLIEITAVDHKGREFPIELTIIPLKENHNQFFCAFIRDITDRKKTEEFLKTNRETYASLVNTVDGIVWEADVRSFAFTFVSERAERLLGYPLRIWLEEPNFWSNHIHPDDRDYALNYCLECTKLMIPHEFEYRMMAADGRIVWLKDIVTVIVENNQPVQLRGIMIDITNQKTIEAALESSEKNLRQVLSSTADNFYVIDRDFRITLINRSAEQNLKVAWGTDITIGTNILDVIPNEEDKLIRESLGKVFTGEKVEYELHLTINGLPEWVLVNFMPVVDENDIVVGAYIMSKDISERKRIEAGLKRSIERFEMIAATTHDAIWEWDLETGEIWGNAVHHKLYGLGSLDPVPTERMWQQKIHPDDREAILSDLEKALASDKDAWIAEYRFLTSQGYRNIYDRSYIVRNENKKPVRIMGSMMDITERTIAEEHLKNSQKQLLASIENTPNVAVQWYNRKGEVVFWNHASELIFGWKSSEAMGKTLDKLIHTPEGMAEFLETIEFVERTGETIGPAEFSFLRKDGSKGICLSTLFSIHSLSGEPCFVCMDVDITERNKAEELVKESEERYKALVENAPEALVVFDVELRKFVNVSRSAEKLFKMSREELLQIGPIDLSPEFQPDGRLSSEAAMENINAVIVGEKPFFEWTHCDKDGNSIPCEVWLVRLPSDNRILIRGSVRDVSVRKKAELAIKQSEEKYRSLIEQASDPILTYSLDGTIVSCNNAFLTSSGYQKTDIENLKLTDLLYEEDLKENPLRFDLIKKGVAVHDVRRTRRKDGSEMPVELNSKMMTDGNIMVIARDITERKKAEALLLKEKDFSDAVINNLPGIFVMLDENGKYLRWNKNFETVSGYSDAEILELNPTSLIDSDEAEQVTQKMKQVFEHGESSLEVRFFTKRKTEKVPYHFSGWRMFVENRPCIIGIGYDLTDRKKADYLLRASEEKYRTLVEQAVDAIALYDSSGKILDVNTGSVNLLGYRKQELTTMNLSDVLTSEEIKAKPVRYDILQKGESTVKQRLMKKKDGSVVQTEVRSQQLPDGRFLSVIRDLTERITAQEQIEREKELSDSIINSLPGLFYLIDKKGRFIRWNKLKEQLTGYSADEIRNMMLLDFFKGTEKERIRKKIKEGFANGTTDVEAHIVTKSGKKILYYFTGISIEYEGQRCLMGTGIDISDRKEAELELESSYKAIRQLTEHLQNIREEERTHIAREIHDELGQKLTVLKMDISWINKKLPAKEDIIKARLKELLSMLDDTVKSVRRISSELRPSLLDDLGLTAAMEWHLNEFQKRFDIKTHFKSVEEFLLPEAMKTGLFRIFQESLTNVARHAEAKKVSVTLEKENGTVVLSVTDDGVGFDKQNVASKKTLGILGMKERTSMIGGTYEIISKPGKGTKVVVTIPLGNKN